MHHPYGHRTDLKLSTIRDIRQAKQILDRLFSRAIEDWGCHRHTLLASCVRARDHLLIGQGVDFLIAT